MITELPFDFKNLLSSQTWMLFRHKPLHLQWKAVNENTWLEMKSDQWKRLASNEKQPMKKAGLQWKVLNEMGWPALKSAQWKHEKQWKVVNEKAWPAMKTYWKLQGLLWKSLHHNKT